MWTRVLRPLLFRLDAEQAHTLTMGAFTVAMRVPGVRRLVAGSPRALPGPLQTSLLGLEFPSPVVLAAGFDKDAQWFNELAALGFGGVEVGTLTAHPQPGNPRPRLFRLPEDRALLNRFGFNNRGSAAAAASLSSAERRVLLGVNIGKSKVTPNEEAPADYLQSLERLHPFADWFTVNVSSPNTAGLRDLQAAEPLRRLLGGLVARNRTLAEAAGSRPPPILVKVAPDLDEQGRRDIVSIALETGIDGIVATNTTLSREGLVTSARDVEVLGAGGISGAPLTARSRDFVAELYRAVGGQLPIIGVGGIMNGDDAWEMIRHGASLVQVYTGFIYGGPRFVRDVNGVLSRRLSERGVTDLSTVVGEALR
ncbi:MAG: quinone-dependent dihydroorotate dehydrogenase [Deltaproteobacteria bacterium]|nr:MAG: quinone-dependent dihydroorotate dehydrogenase [Deltaproteobacteria bacterium]